MGSSPVTPTRTRMIPARFGPLRMRYGLTGRDHSFEGMTDEEIFFSDYKEYEAGDVHYSIGCAERSLVSGIYQSIIS